MKQVKDSRKDLKFRCVRCKTDTIVFGECSKCGLPASKPKSLSQLEASNSKVRSLPVLAKNEISFEEYGNLCIYAHNIKTTFGVSTAAVARSQRILTSKQLQVYFKSSLTKFDYPRSKDKFYLVKKILDDYVKSRTRQLESLANMVVP